MKTITIKKQKYILKYTLRAFFIFENLTVDSLRSAGCWTNIYCFTLFFWQITKIHS